MGRTEGPPEAPAGRQNREGPFSNNLISDEPVSDARGRGEEVGEERTAGNGANFWGRMAGRTFGIVSPRSSPLRCPFSYFGTRPIVLFRSAIGSP